jgi:RNA polymerase sigma-70 factor, ECF subfamily
VKGLSNSRKGGKRLEDSEIIPLLKDDPSKGLYEAVQKYRSYAAAIIGRILGENEQDLEECIADAFVAVWKTVQSGQEFRSLKGCVACAARNTAINRYKKLSRERTAYIEEEELSSGEDIMLDFEDEANAHILQELITGMDEPDREIFVRKYFLFESVREISKRTELNEIQIKNRLYRGRQKLRRQLEERDVTA